MSPIICNAGEALGLTETLLRRLALSPSTISVQTIFIAIKELGQFQLYTIIFCMIRVYIVLATLAFSLSQGRHRLESTCKLGFGESQWRQQQKANELAIKAAKQTFKTNSQLLPYMLFRYKYNFKREYQTFRSQTSQQIQSYTFIFKSSLLVFAAICIFWIFKFINSYGNRQSKRFTFIDSPTVNTALQAVLLICVLIAFFVAILGFLQGAKTQKTLADLVCKIYEGPKNIIKGGQGPTYNGYNAYINQIQKYQSKFRSNFQSLQHVFSKQYVIKQMVSFGKKMLQSAQPRSKQLVAFHEQMNKTVTTLQNVDLIIPKIKKALRWFNKTLEYSKQLVVIASVSLTTAQQYSNQHVSFETVIGLFASLIKVFYGVLIMITGGVAFTMASILLKRQNSLKISHSLIKCLFIILIIICLTVAYAHSFAIPAVIWSNSVIDYVSRGQLYVRNQFNLPFKVRADLVALLTHILPVNASDFTTLYHGHLMKNISQYGTIIQPYYQTNTNYFDQLFDKGVQLNEESQGIDVRRIRFLQKQMLMKDLLVNFQITKEGVKQILSTIEPNGQLATINPSAIGGHFRNINGVIRGPLFNRIYNGRWMCGSIGILLLIALTCLTLTKEMDKKESKYKMVESQEKSAKQSQLFTNDSIS